MAEAHRDEIAKLEALYASNPEGRVFTHLAEAYRKAGEPGRAREILSEGMRRHPDSASAFVVLGRVLSDSGDAEGGFEAFRQALELDTGNLVALRWCGDLAMRVGRIDDAVGYYHELMARDPSDANLRERVAIIEADRAAEMSAVQPSPPDEAPSGLSLEHDPTDDMAAGGALQDFDPTDLPGDLAAFAGRQIESRGGKAWDPALSSDEIAQQQADDEMFASGEMLDVTGFQSNELDLSAFGDSSDSIDDSTLDFGAESAFEGGLDLTEPDTEPDTESTPELDVSTFEGFTEPVPELPAFDGVLPAFDEASPAFDEVLPAFDEATPAAFADIPIDVMEPADGAAPTEEYAWNPSETEAAEAALPEPAPAADLGEVDPGGFGEAVGPSYDSLEDVEDAAPAGIVPVAPVTETMAELYRNQGFPERAADVYRQLLRERGSDARLEDRLAEIEAELATPSGVTGDGNMILDQDESGEMWLREAESPWMAGEPGGAQHESPYTLGAEIDEPAETQAPIASYFQSLLQWRPRTDEAAADAGATALADPGDATEAYDDVLLLDDAAGGMEPWAAESATSPTSHDELLLLSDQAAPAAAAELMPWETQAAPAAPAAAPPEAVAPAAPVLPTQELMPWETAPAAPSPAVESSPETPAQAAADRSAESGVGSFASWYDTEAGTGGGGHPAGNDAGGEDSEDDEDLEVFRSWLQSLKK